MLIYQKSKLRFCLHTMVASLDFGVFRGSPVSLFFLPTCGEHAPVVYRFNYNRRNLF